MTDQNGGNDRDRQRWQWVGADPDDRSEDARFRREVAALTREVMLARGATPDAVPPISRTHGKNDPAVVRLSSTNPAAVPTSATDPGQVPASATANLEVSRSPGYFDIHSSTPYLLALAGRTVLFEAGSTGSPTGVATTDLVLLTVARSPRGSTTTQLATTLGVPPSTVSMAAGRLVDRGWVVRQRSSRDRRRTLLVATATGRQAAERAAAVWRHADDRLLDGMTLTERDELCRLLRRAVSALAARRPSG